MSFHNCHSLSEVFASRPFKYWNPGLCPSTLISLPCFWLLLFTRIHTTSYTFYFVYLFLLLECSLSRIKDTAYFAHYPTSSTWNWAWHTEHLVSILLSDSWVDKSLNLQRFTTLDPCCLSFISSHFCPGCCYTNKHICVTTTTVKVHEHQKVVSCFFVIDPPSPPPWHH